MGLFSRHDKAVLLVCTENICRSPMAEGILRAELARRELNSRIKVASAGTRVGQPGSRPDKRARRVCQEVGVDIGRCRARQVVAADFAAYDFILALDAPNHDWLLENAAEQHRHKVLLVGDLAGGGEVLDPYYGNLAGFERVRGEIQRALDGIIDLIL